MSDVMIMMGKSRISGFHE